MAITTVLPNGTASGASLFAVTGAATIHQALNDGSDSTFVKKSSSLIGITDAIIDFGTLTLSSSQRVKRVRVRARCSTPTINGKINIYLGSRIDNENYFYSALSVRGTNSATTFTGPFYTSTPNGSDWNQASINSLRAKIQEYKDSSDIGTIYELYIDVDIATKPTVTVSSISPSTTSPDVSWTYADTDNETQAYYQFKVFTAAQYGAGGFNPETSTAIYDSGQVASTDQSSVIGTLLLPATYRAYVRVAKQINNTPFWSDYAYNQFTISYTAPTIPTMSVVWSDSLGRASFTLTGVVPTGYTSQYYEIQRSDDDGVTYNLIRNGSGIIPNVSYVGTAFDYEAPRSIISYYRCRSVGVDSSLNEFPSAWGTVQQIAITSDLTWWFKAVSQPSLNKGSIRVLRDTKITVEEPNNVFRRLGEDRPIVVSGLIQGEDGQYSIKTINETEWNNILPLLNHQGVILAQDPYSNQKYIRIISRNWSAKNEGSNVHRNIDIGYVEVNG